MGLWSKVVDRSKTGKIRIQDKERRIPVISINNDFYVIVEEERDLIHVHKNDYRGYGIYVMDTKRKDFKWGENMSIYDIIEVTYDCTSNKDIMENRMFKLAVIRAILENY